MLSLADRLRERIRREGPMSFHDWMAIALYDPEQGYYCADRQRWGRAGDYRTSPERTVLFAAAFARYFAKLYRELGAPSQWVVIEGGSGAGAFAAGVLATLRLRFPEVFKATSYVLAETSNDARNRARLNLAGFETHVRFQDLSTIQSANPGIIFSNELLDAFPVHRVLFQEGRLHEFFVAVGTDGEFNWQLGGPSSERLLRYLEAGRVQLAEGQIAEINPGIEEWIKGATAKLTRGYCVTVDYGAEAAELFSPRLHPTGTLRSFDRHQITNDVLQNPGEQDVTSSVDWTHVKRIGDDVGLKTLVFESQDQFLIEAGLLEELELRVNEAKDEGERSSLRTEAREMILPGGMASSFQVLVQEKQ